MVPTIKVNTVVIIHKFKLVRDSMSKVFQSNSAFKVVGTYAGLQEARKKIEQIEPNVLLMDVTKSSSGKKIADFAVAHPEVNTIALGISLDAKEIVFFAQSGVSGYVSCDASEIECLETVVGAVNGEITNPKIAGILNRHIRDISRGKLTTFPTDKLPKQSVQPKSDAQLTFRETDVIRLIDRGMTNKQIARELHVELSTIKNHVHSILTKFSVKRCIQAAAHFRSLTQGDGNSS